MQPEHLLADDDVGITLLPKRLRGPVQNPLGEDGLHRRERRNVNRCR